MGFPIARLAGRAAFIGAIIAGGLLAAGIAQAQAQPLSSNATPAAEAAAATSPGDNDGQLTSADRQAELIAAAGGPAPAEHLMTVAPERPAVEARADDVEDATPDPADALNAAEAAHDRAPATPAADPAAPR